MWRTGSCGAGPLGGAGCEGVLPGRAGRQWNASAALGPSPAGVGYTSRCAELHRGGEVAAFSPQVFLRRARGGAGGTKRAAGREAAARETGLVVTSCVSSGWELHFRY